MSASPPKADIRQEYIYSSNHSVATGANNCAKVKMTPD